MTQRRYMYNENTYGGELQANNDWQSKNRKPFSTIGKLKEQTVVVVNQGKGKFNRSFSVLGETKYVALLTSYAWYSREHNP